MRQLEITILMWPEPDDKTYDEFFNAIAGAAYTASPKGFEVDVSARLVNQITDGESD